MLDIFSCNATVSCHSLDLYMDKYRVDMAGLQETNACGSGVYRVAESVVTVSGWSVPGRWAAN